MTRNSFVKETRWNERCVNTTYVDNDDGWTKVEDRVPLRDYDSLDRQRNCFVFTHNEGLVIPTSGAAPRVSKRQRQDPVVSGQHKRKTFTRGQRKRYEGSCPFLSYSDEAMWSQLKPATMPMPFTERMPSLDDGIVWIDGLDGDSSPAWMVGGQRLQRSHAAERLVNRQAEDDQ